MRAEYGNSGLPWVSVTYGSGWQLCGSSKETYFVRRGITSFRVKGHHPMAMDLG